MGKIIKYLAIAGLLVSAVVFFGINMILGTILFVGVIVALVIAATKVLK